MNALQSYSSDEEPDVQPITRKGNVKMDDPGTNYDDVGMDISEDSDGSDENEHNRENSSKHQSENNSSSASNVGKNSEKHIDNRSSMSKKRERSQERNLNSREKEGKQASKDIKRMSSSRDDRSSNERSNASSSRTARDHKPDRKSSDHREHKRSRDDRHRSRSRERRRSRSRSRSRDRRRRSRSKDRDRRKTAKPHEIRKEAQAKLAALKASNPDYDHNEMLKKGMEAQYAEIQKTTGVALPSYYNPAVMNPVKIAEQERKKRLLWGNKSKPATEPSTAIAAPTVAAPVVSHSLLSHPLGGEAKQAGVWANTKFSNDSDGKMAEKFKRLMGVKGEKAAGSAKPRPEQDLMQKQETMFTSMEKQYEVARLATHTHKGFGLGFSSQPYLPKQ